MAIFAIRSSSLKMGVTFWWIICQLYHISEFGVPLQILNTPCAHTLE